MKHAKDASNWERMVKFMVLIDELNASSSNLKEDDDANEDNGEGGDDSRNEPRMQTLP